MIDEDFCWWCALDDDDVMDTSVFNDDDDGRPNAGRDDDDGRSLPLLLILYLAADVDGDMANGEKLNADVTVDDTAAVDRTAMHAEE